MSRDLRTIALGFHSQTHIEQYTDFCSSEDYEVRSASTPSGFLELIAKTKFDRYLMDLNLGHSRTSNIEPARQAYNILRKRVEEGNAKFMGVSHTANAVSLARAEGIPSIDHGSFSYRDLLNFLS